MGPEGWALEAEGLSKAFGHKWALRGVALQVHKGSFLCIFGPNGAGKTTLLKTLATLIRPTSGSLRLLGLEAQRYPSQVRRLIGVVTHQPLLYGELTAHENLRFYGRMFAVPRLEERIGVVIRQVGLEARLRDRVRTLSHGMQRRLSIARALLHEPELLLLDEPETGLDAYAVELLRSVLAGFKAEARTVIMTTHNLERGLQWADQALILVGGRVVYQGAKPFLDVAALQGTYFQESRAAS